MTNQVPMNFAVSQFAAVSRAGKFDEAEFPILAFQMFVLDIVDNCLFYVRLTGALGKSKMSSKQFQKYPWNPNESLFFSLRCCFVTFCDGNEHVQSLESIPPRHSSHVGAKPDENIRKNTEA